VRTCNGKILVISGEIEVGLFLKKRLTALDYTVLLISNTNLALRHCANEQFDLVISDVILSNLDGYEVCRKIRQTSKIPIILLSSLGNIKNLIMGLDLGADDFLIKPFSPKELEARIRVLLRRYGIHNKLPDKRKKNTFKIGSLVINLNTKLVSKNGFNIKLTNIEYSLLELLVNNAGKKMSRTIILDNVWGYTPQRMVDIRIVDVHIARLRAKIEEDTSNPEFIMTARGIGYTFLNQL
jgi:OmpR family response regulator RpaB